MKIFKIKKIAAPIPYEDDDFPIELKEKMGFRRLNNLIDEKEKLRIEKIIGKGSPLGAGYFGIAYDIGNGKVAKLTSDKREKIMGEIQMKNNLDAFVKVYDIMEYEDKSFDILITEKVKVLEKTKAGRFNLIQKMIFSRNDGFLISDAYLNTMTPQTEADKEVAMSFDKLSSEKELIKDMFSLMSRLKRIGTSNKFIWECHGENVGYNQSGELVVLDFGTGF